MKKSHGGLYSSYLVHPLTWLMALLLLCNDLILKPFFPSPLSGKLSDFSLVYLLPLILVAVGSLIPSTRLQRLLPWLGFGLPVILFGFGKTIPAVNSAIYQTLSAILPFKTHFVLDPTDAFALIMLLPAAWVWKQSMRDAASPSKRYRWVLLPFLMAITLADAAAPDYGISCLEPLPDGSILAQASYFSLYQSNDGGLTWQTAAAETRPSKDCRPVHGNDPYPDFTSSSGLLLRFENSARVLESTDNGQSWAEVYGLNQYSQAEMAFRKIKSSNLDFTAVPLDIIEDSKSGNLLAAMGHHGVLVRRPAGGWIPVAVGGYRPAATLQEAGLAGYFSLLWVEWIMCILQAVFLFSLFNLRREVQNPAAKQRGRPRRRWWRVVKVILAWIGWVLMMLFSPAVADSYLRGSLIAFALPVAVIWAVFCVVDDIISWIKQSARGLIKLLPLVAACSLLSAAVYGLWAANVIPAYNLALGLVLGFTLISAIIGTIGSGALRHQEEKDG